MDVLIVEDEVQLRRTLAHFFEQRGFSVTEAGSLEGARGRLARGRFDALVIDVGLPDGDGLELLRSIDPRKCLIVSAMPDLERYSRRRVQHHMPKPFDPRAVLETVRALCRPVDGIPCNAEWRTAR